MDEPIDIKPFLRDPFVDTWMKHVFIPDTCALVLWKETRYDEVMRYCCVRLYYGTASFVSIPVRSMLDYYTTLSVPPHLSASERKQVEDICHHAAKFLK